MTSSSPDWDRQILAMLATRSRLDLTLSVLLDTVELHINGVKGSLIIDLRGNDQVKLADSKSFSNLPINNKSARYKALTQLVYATSVVEPTFNRNLKELSPLFAIEEIDAIWFFPILSVLDDRVAVMVVCSSHRHLPNEDEWQTIEEAVSLASLAFENDSERIITERKAEYFKEIIDSMTAFYWEADPLSFKVVYSNKRELICYDKCDHESSWEKAIHPEDWHRVMDMRQRAVRLGGQYCYEYRFVSQGQNILWLKEEVSMVKLANGLHRLRGVAFDISSYKQEFPVLAPKIDRGHLY